VIEEVEIQEPLSPSVAHLRAYYERAQETNEQAFLAVTTAATAAAAYQGVLGSYTKTHSDDFPRSWSGVGSSKSLQSGRLEGMMPKSSVSVSERTLTEPHDFEKRLAEAKAEGYRQGRAETLQAGVGSGTRVTPQADERVDSGVKKQGTFVPLAGSGLKAIIADLSCTLRKVQDLDVASQHVSALASAPLEAEIRPVVCDDIKSAAVSGSLSDCFAASVSAVARDGGPVSCSGYTIPATKPSLRAEINSFLSKPNLGGLRYAVNNPATPGACVGLVHNGQKHLAPKTLIDDGANTGIVTLALVEKLGIPYDRRDVTLATSNGASTVIGLTAPIQLHFGSLEQGYTSRQCFLVMDGPCGLYDLLVGNRDFNLCRGILDARAQTMTLKPYGMDEVVINTYIKR
jgi:hypothetical protein